MPEQDQANPLEIATDTAVDELTLLKERARLMGITFSNNISLETLRKRVNDKLEGNDDDGDPEIATIAAKAPVRLSERENAVALRKLMQEKQMRLVRLRITNMDPKKKDLFGEVWTVANEYLGTVRKYVPYGEQTDAGYHVPYCIYRLLDSKRFLQIRDVRDPVTKAVRQETIWAKEFSLEVLPQLTQDELDKLAAAQAAAAGG